MRKEDLKEVIVYYLVAFALALAVACFAQGLGDGAKAMTMFTPAIAVLFVMVLFVPFGSRRAFIYGLGIHRFGRRGYGLAIGAPALIFGSSLIVLLALGATSIRAEAGASIPRIVVSSLIGLIITTILALGEEIGWRGYLLPKLLPIGALPAMLVVGFLHAVWHLPLILLTGLYHAGGDLRLVVPMFLVTLTLAGVFYGYLRVTTGSVWPPAIAHAAVGTFWNATARLSEATSPVVEEYVGGECGIVMIAGLLVLTTLLARQLKAAAPA